MINKNGIDGLLESFKIALALEREGKKLFREAAEKTRSRLARQTFEYLAAEEERHIERIEEFYNALSRSGGSDIPDTADSTADEKLETFNRMLEELKDTYQSTSSDIEAYKMALDFETSTEDFYEENLKECQDAKIRKFYRWLIDEETMHSRLLRSCLRFVEDPAEWFRMRKKVL
ncbi:MAG: ferritin family protein [Candidatus Zixiibacteriota bacterium]|nr:MAG: ferritin family protein [candidate division Zixibacteria bacterium]